MKEIPRRLRLKLRASDFRDVGHGFDCQTFSAVRSRCMSLSRTEKNRRLNRITTAIEVGKPQWVEALETRRFLSAASDAVSDIIATPNLTLSPSASTSTVSGYTPKEIKKAYGFDSISFGK